MDRHDVIAVAGLAMLAAGLTALAGWPTALCVTGGILMAVGVASAWAKGGRG